MPAPAALLAEWPAGYPNQAPRGPAPSRASGVIRSRRARPSQAHQAPNRAAARAHRPPLPRTQEPLPPGLENRCSRPSGPPSSSTSTRSGPPCGPPRHRRNRPQIGTPTGGHLGRLESGTRKHSYSAVSHRSSTARDGSRTHETPAVRPKRPHGHGRRRLLLAHGSRRHVPAFRAERVALGFNSATCPVNEAGSSAINSAADPRPTVSRVGLR
jgi:hypothetical protein